MGILIKFNNIMEKILMVITTIQVILFSFVVFFQVIARDVIRISCPWTDEAALMLFVYSVFLGSAICVRKRSHYVVDLIPRKLVRTGACLDCLATFLSGIMIVVFFIGGITFTKMGLKRNFDSLPFTEAWLFASMPIMAFGMFFFSIENIIKDAKKIGKAFRGEIKPPTDIIPTQGE